MKNRSLGRGLQALLGMDEPDETAMPMESAHVPPSGLTAVPLDAIDVNPYQPRRSFDPEELRELADSIRRHGVIQPVVARAVGERYQLVAGERRFRAARLAGLEEIPVRLLELDEQKTFEIALIENLQRRDLNAIEKARAFTDYLAKFGGTHEQLAEHLGVDRSTVSNLLRLLELPQAVQQAVTEGKLSMGHARALLAVGDPARQIELCAQIIAEQLSVRAVEQLTKEPKGEATGAAPSSKAKSSPAKSHHVEAIENELRQRLGTRLEIQLKDKDKGTLAIYFNDTNDFERIVAAILGRPSI